MKKLSVALLFLVASHCMNAQNVGIGTSNPTEKLEVNGGIKLGNTTNATSGTIRWNEANKDFEGFNGTSWVSLSGRKTWGNQTSYAFENGASSVFLNFSPTGSGTGFGTTVVGFGDLIITGAPNDNSVNSIPRTGSIHSFIPGNPDFGGWERKDFSFGENISVQGDQFLGTSLAVSPNFIVAGGPGYDGNAFDEGRALVFSYNPDGAIDNANVKSLRANDASQSDWFGFSVAMNDSIIIVGAPNKDLGVIPNRRENAGKVYIYQLTNGLWNQTGSITAPDFNAEDNFGYSVALNGNYLAISAPGKTVNNIAMAGKLYLYQKIGNGWTLLNSSIIRNSNSVSGQRYGQTICFKQNRLFVGMYPYASTEIFPVEAYAFDNGNLSFLGSINPTEPAAYGFGCAIDYLDGVLLIGAPEAIVLSGVISGKAFAFEWSNNSFIPVAILTSAVPENYQRFGTSVALLPGQAIVGAPEAALGSMTNNGRLFFYKR